MNTLAPGPLGMFLAVEFFRDPVDAILIFPKAHDIIHLALVRLILGVHGFGSEIKINPVTPGVRKVHGQIGNHGAPGCGPVSGQAPGPAKHIRVFAERIQGNKPAETRSHDKRVGLIRQGRIIAVNEGFKFFNNKYYMVSQDSKIIKLFIEAVYARKQN